MPKHPLYQSEQDSDREQYVILRSAKILGADLRPVKQHGPIDAIFVLDGADTAVEVKCRHPKYRKRIEKDGVMLSKARYNRLARMKPALFIVSFGYGDIYIHDVTDTGDWREGTVSTVQPRSPDKVKDVDRVVYIPLNKFRKLV